MRQKILYICLAASICVNGCAKVGALLTLKHYGDNQRAIDRYVEKQEQLFERLLQDMLDEKLEVGMSKRQFIATYGEPIFSHTDEALKPGEVLLYRHPTNYFTSDRIYVYFDGLEQLSRWEYKPYLPEPE